MRKFSTPAVFTLHAALAAALLCAFSGVQAKAPPVGEVTLTIGRAMVISSTGESEVAQRGSKIQSGDRVETSDGGHVHIRFIDGALVSVRPTSRLVIEDYQYNPALPAQSTVRFRLDQGVTRAISGEAAHAAKDRFRLNTPLVAIGVRGTDFVVRTQAGQTLAAVNQGSIVMAPFGDGCLPSALGPCASPASRYLSADMGRVFAEFRSQFAQLDIKPLPQLQTSAAPGVMLASARMEAEPAVTVPRESVKPESVSAVTGALVQGALRKALDDDIVASQVVVPPVVVSPPKVEVPPVVVVPVVPVPTGPAQLSWGRWGAAGPAGPGGNDFALPRSDSAEGRVATVGNLPYILYRTEPVGGVSTLGSGSFNFNLQQAYVQLVTPTAGLLPATVQSGNLSIDFAARQFATSLKLTSVPTGAVQMTGTGFVRSDGIFVGTTPGQVLAGALATDAKTAGYFFEKPTASGVLSGVTLWGR